MRLPAIFAGLMFLGVTLAQSPQPKAFEAASIKPMELGGVMMGFSSSGSRVRLEGYTQFYLIAEAFHLKFYQITPETPRSRTITSITSSLQKPRVRRYARAMNSGKCFKPCWRIASG